MKKTFILSIFLVPVLLISALAQEQNTDLSPEKILTIPSKISYQGILTDNNGTLLNGSYPMEFGLYTSSSGGSFLWSESQSVPIENGIFNVLLGASTPIPPSLAFDLPYWLQVSVSGSALPRIELSSSAYSFNTSRIQGQPVSSDSPSSGKVLKWTGSEWAPGTDETTGGTAGGDLDGTYPDPTVIKIQNRTVSSSSPSTGEVLKWTGSQWSPGTDETGGLTLPYIGTTSTSSTAFTIINNGSGSGIYGFGLVGVAGKNSSNGYGVYGQADATSGTNYGVYGETYSPSGYGVYGRYSGGGTNDGIGVYGQSSPANWFGYGGSFRGGYIGIYGLGSGGSASQTIFGMYGKATGTAGTRYGVYGTTSGGTTRRAGYFSGDLQYTGSLIGPSDEQFKQNVQSLSGALSKLMRLEPRTFTYKNSEEYKTMNLPQGKQYGLVAQELEKIFPELVEESVHPLTSPDDKGTEEKVLRYKGVKYVEIIPILIQAIKEQQEMIEALKSDVQQLKSR